LPLVSNQKNLPSYALAAAKALALFGFAVLKWQAINGKDPIYTGDGRVWATIGEAPLFSENFFFARRPFFMPLLFKLVGGSDSRIVQLDLILSIFAWGVLAYALSRLLRGVPSLLALAGTLAVGLSTPIHAWDLFIRAESSSHSVLVLTMACLIQFLLALPKGPIESLAWAAVTAICSFFCANARDTNGYFLLILVGVVTSVLWFARPYAWLTAGRFEQRHRLWRRVPVISGAIVILALVGSTAVAQFSAKRALRYDFPLVNVIFQRVLPDAERRKYFVEELAMPMSDALMTRKRKWASANRRYAFRAPELEEFRDWLITKGYSEYQRYLLTHWRSTWAEAYVHFPRVLGYKVDRGGRAARTPVSDQIDDYVTSGPLVAWPGLFSGLAALVGAGAVVRKGYRNRVLGLFVLALVLGAISQLYICYHADAMEVNRHSVVVGLLLRLSLVASAALVLSWVLELSKRVFVLIGGSSGPPSTLEQQRSSTPTDSASVVSIR
jgi:hypothetical protein